MRVLSGPVLVLAVAILNAGPNPLLSNSAAIQRDLPRDRRIWPLTPDTGREGS
jgi:hypothetical protein